MIYVQWILLIAIAPLLAGFIAKVKNNIRMRQGQSLGQPYYNLAKLFSKGETISESASWIFKATPLIVLSSTLVASLFIPVLVVFYPAASVGDFLALLFILALGRFFLALAALDTASAFGGMGSSREMFIASLVEPVACLVVFSLFLQYGSSNIAAFNGTHAFTLASLAGAIALFLIVLAETSRIPVDNQETHLELTMVHEAMVLEYSGRSLAFLEMASYVKQMVWFFLIAQIIFPISLPLAGDFVQLISWFLWYLVRIIIVALAVVLVEVSVAKMRLFRVADFLGFAFVLAAMATICAVLGV